MRAEGKNYKNTVEYAIWLAGLVMGALAVLGAVLVHAVPVRAGDLGMECWIHRSAGIYCPGCGGTRAVFALFQGKVLLSFYYHPAVLYAAVLYLAFMLRGLLSVITGGGFTFMRWRLGYVYFGIAVILLQCLVKNVLLLGFHLQWMT